MSEFRWVHIQSKEEFKSFCESLLPKIREVAKTCGYALGVHGSLMRDFDLIAVPWAHRHSDKDTLAREIHRVACGLENHVYEWEAKPCQRFAASFPICWPDWASDGKTLSAGHIDLSVIELKSPLSSGG